MGTNIERINEKTFKGWFLNNFDADDITEMDEIGAEHFGPFIYYADTSMLYEQFGEEIWDLVGEVAETYYSNTVQGVLAERNDDIDTPARFECVMVRLAAAYLAHKLRLEGLGIGINDEEVEGDE